MAIGDDAAAAGMAILDGTEDRRDGYVEINRTRDYLAQRTSTVAPISKGGTGATTAAAARSNLGANDASNLSTGTIPNNRIAAGAINTARLANDAVNGAKIVDEAIEYNHLAEGLQSEVDKIGNAGALTTGTLTRPVNASGNVVASGDIGCVGRMQSVGSRAFTVSSSYVSAYMDGSGYFGAAPSAERFKQDITRHEYTLGQLQLIQVVSYRLKTAVLSNPDATGEVGVIAEELINAGLPEFVIFDEAGQTQSVAYERLVLVTIGAMQDLANRVAAIDARLTALEEK